MEKALEVLIGSNWASSAVIILKWLFLASSLSLILLYVHKKYGRKHSLALLFFIAGMDYIRIDAKYLDMHPNLWLLSLACTAVGFILIFLGGAVTFTQDDDDDGDDGDKNPEDGPGPENKKVVDDFVRSCQNEFLAGLKK